MGMQREIEIILARQLASYLAMPIFLVDPQGTLIFFNEPAEIIFGRRFEETGAMPISEWSTIFTPMADDGAPLPPQAMPLAIAVEQRRPSFRTFWIKGLDGVRRHIGVAAVPLVGQADRFLGAIALFWETTE